MYAGHIAAGLAIKAAEPRAPTWALVLGAGWLDIVHGVLVLAGVEHVKPDATKFLAWELVDMPWSHSLAATVVWSILAALVFSRRGRAVGLAVGLAVFSHFALDFPMHEHDLALAPGSNVMLGLSLWSWSAIGAWAIEGALVAACLAAYVRRTHAWLVVAFVAVLHVSFLPALSAVRMAGLHFAG